MGRVSLQQIRDWAGHSAQPSASTISSVPALANPGRAGHSVQAVKLSPTTPSALGRGSDLSFAGKVVGTPMARTRRYQCILITSLGWIALVSTAISLELAPASLAKPFPACRRANTAHLCAGGQSPGDSWLLSLGGATRPGEGRGLEWTLAVCCFSQAFHTHGGRGDPQVKPRPAAGGAGGEGARPSLQGAGTGEAPGLSGNAGLTPAEVSTDIYPLLLP